MTASPVDIIANAIRTACEGQPPAGLAVPLAEVAAKELSHDDIVDNAVRDLVGAGWGTALSRADLRNIAETVLRSVDGAP